MVPSLQQLQPSLVLSLVTWVGALSAAAAYVSCLWLVPDLRNHSDSEIGSMEQYFKNVATFDRSCDSFDDSPIEDNKY